MSNQLLRAEISRLESQLHDIERKNEQLRAEIGAAVNGVNQAEQNLSAYNQQIRSSLDRASNVINDSTQRALEAYELQGQIDQLYTRYKQVELANKKIRALNNKKYYDFQNYRVVRKIVKGMMDNLDLHMVSDAVIYKSIERQHLLTPDYWLTCVLISIMAWRADDRLLADRALESAYRLDTKNSSIFYMIFNLRMEREESAVKWFLEYQKCELKGGDEHTFLMLFSLISKTLSDQVDEEISGMISDYIHKLMTAQAKKTGYREEDIVTALRQHMLKFMRTESYDLPLLAKYCTNYASIERMLNLAGNNYNILAFILKTVHVSAAERNTYLKEYLNELLAKPNDAEIETYREIEYQERVIEMGGDIEGAKASFDEELARRDGEFDLISTMIGWVYDFSNEDVNGQMRLNMFTLLKSFQEKAAASYFAGYRDMYRTVDSVSILDYCADVDFMDEAGETVKAENRYQEQQKQELSHIKNLPAYLSLAAGVACGGMAFFVHPFLFAGLGIGAVIGAGLLLSNRFRRKNVILKMQKQKESVLGILHQLFAEHEKMRRLYEGFDEISGKIVEELAKL